MRCTSCGLPLSPARTMTSCPRCGTPIADKKSPAFPAQQPFPQTETWKPVAPQTQLPEVVRSSMSHPEGARELQGAPAELPFRATTGSDPFRFPGTHVQSPVTVPPASPAVPAYVPQPTPQLDPMWLPTPVSQRNQDFDAQQVQEYGQAGLGGFRPEAIGADQSAMGAKELIGAPQAPLRPLQHDGLKRGTINRAPTAPTRSKNNLGFIVAGLCVIMGGLILVFVYIMALGSPGNSNSSNTPKTNTATSSPISASSPASSPTVTPFPGQKYIDHAQLASSIDPTSHQATQITTTFKTNQRIYITFQVHPNGQSGAACLLWYVNNKVFFPFALPVYPNEQATYSYASYGGTGSGYVEIYWASTTKCTDKILAQHVDFMVTS